MTQATPALSGALAEHLDAIATEIKEELAHLYRAFKDAESRCTKIGNALVRARGNFPTSEAFYAWAEEAVGIKGRQCRTYLRFTDRLPAIKAAAEDQGVEITSMEQGLALLAPAKPEETRTEDEIKISALVQAASRAKGTIGRAIEALSDVTPGGLSPDQLKVLEQAITILAGWSQGKLPASTELAVNCQPAPDWSEADTPTPNPTPSLSQLSETESPTKPQPLGGTVESLANALINQAFSSLVVTEPKPPAEPVAAGDLAPNPDPSLTGKGDAVGLPMHLKPGKWTLAQLVEGEELYGSQAALAKALGCSRSAINNQIKAKQAAAGLTEES